MSTNGGFGIGYTDWCRQHFNALADGGKWAIPRAGIIFQRRGRKLVLVERMPHAPEMEERLTPEQLLEMQTEEYEMNKRYFEAVGITVEDAT